MDKLEEKIAHLERVTDDLSDIISRQAAEIDRLTHRVEILMSREADRMASDSSHLFTGQERPPHY